MKTDTNNSKFNVFNKAVVYVVPKVAQYRDLIDTVNRTVVDLHACVGDREKTLCVQRLKRAGLCLIHAVCPRAKDADLADADAAIERSADRIRAFGMESVRVVW